MKHKIIPIFRIFNYEKSIEFYVNFLGFQIDWEDKRNGVPIYLQVSRHDISIHLSEHHGDCSPGAKIFIECVDGGLKEYQKILAEKNYNYNKPSIDKAEWNALVMEVVDPFGNRIMFNETLPLEEPID